MNKKEEYFRINDKPTHIPLTKIEDIKDKNQKKIIGYDTLSAALVVAKASAQSLPDNIALQVAALFDDFEDVVGQTVEQGFKFRYGGKVWKTAQPKMKIQSIYTPGSGTESLYTVIDEEHAGTIQNPIPAATNMEYEYGKYYSEDGKIYLCKRGGLTDEQAQAMYGQKITLQYLPSQLIGQYFVVAG